MQRRKFRASGKTERNTYHAKSSPLEMQTGRASRCVAAGMTSSTKQLRRSLPNTQDVVQAMSCAGWDSAGIRN